MIVSHLEAAGPTTCCRLEVDEEPPGSQIQLVACPSTPQAFRPRWPQVFPESTPYLVYSGQASRTPRSTPQTRAFRRAFYRDTTDKEWNDWRWQARNRVRTLGQLQEMLLLSEEERSALLQAGAMLPFSITPYYMSLISRDDAQQPLRRTVVPTSGELNRSAGRGRRSAWAKSTTAPAGPGASLSRPRAAAGAGYCSSYCRYCTRSRVVGHGEIVPSHERLEQAFDYIRRTPDDPRRAPLRRRPAAS